MSADTPSSGVRQRARAIPLAALAAVAVAVTPVTPATAAPAVAAATSWTIETPVDRFGLDTRLVLSTMNHAPSEVQRFTIRNGGSGPLRVTKLVKGGTHPSQFALAPGQPTAFSVPAGGTAAVGVRLTSTAYAARFATLDVVTDSGTRTVKLRGIDHRRPDFSGGTEPSLQTLVDVFGFAVRTGVTRPNVARTRDTFGDEVATPYFTKLDLTKPVTMVPLARYVAATGTSSASGSTPLGSSMQRREYGFPADRVDDPATSSVDETSFNQNQEVLPSTTGSTTLSVGPSPFGLHANFANYGDDTYNRHATTGEPLRNLRIYPARDSGGRPIEGAYIVGVDIKVDSSKNFDYQDQVMFLTNVRPSATPPRPGAAALDLGFGAAAGGVPDRDGQGTGFTSVQANSAGSQRLPGLVDLDTASDTLRLTSDAGKSSGAANDQRNALEVTFDGRAGFTVEAELRQPAADMERAFQQKAVWFGPNQDDHLKLEIERRNDPDGTYMTLFEELDGAGRVASRAKLAAPGSIDRLVMRLHASASTGAVTPSWSIDGGPFQSLPAFTIPPADRSTFFAAVAKAGILTSHTAAAGAAPNRPVVAVYDRFRVV